MPLPPNRGNGRRIQDDGDSSSQVPGSILSVTVEDFMQYTATSFRPGPNLNLIVGPNGAGKSSLVLAIALGLGGKPALFGRAKQLGEFVREGKDRASITVEIRGKGGKGSISIQREFTKDGKSTWRIDGVLRPYHEVERLTRELKIQVDNLCQFLPQDKVHEFSKMNPRQLLTKTVEAVGAPELVEDQDKLQRLQFEVDRAAELQSSRQNQLKDLKRKSEALEREAGVYEERKALGDKIELLEKCRLWIVVKESRDECKKSQAKLQKAQATWNKEERKLQLVRDAKGKAKIGKDSSQKEMRQLLVTQKSLIERSKDACEKVEIIDENLDQFDVREQQIVEDEGKRREDIQKYEAAIAELERLMLVDDDPTLEPKLREVNNEVKKLSAAKVDADTEAMRLNNRFCALGREKQDLDREMESVKDVRNRKVQSLRKIGQNNNNTGSGEQACRAYGWLLKNKDLFRERVYEPIMVTLDVVNPIAAIYLEKCVAARDLVALSAEDTCDANLLMTKLRDEQRLKVNVVTLDPHDHPDNYPQPEEYDQLQNIGYRGVVKDLFTCPDSVKAYLCRQFKLHKTPVFGRKAETHIDRIIREFGIRVFFVENTRFEVRDSRYNPAHIWVSSNMITAKGWLQHSVDKDKLKKINDRRREIERDGAALETKIQECMAKADHFGRETEEKRSEVGQLRQKMEYKRTVQTKLELKRDEMRSFLSCQDDAATKKRKLARDKKETVNQVLRESRNLKKMLLELHPKFEKLELERIKSWYYTGIEFELNETLENMMNALKDVISAKNDAREDMREKEEDLNRSLRDARMAVDKNFSGDAAPRQLQRQFADLPGTSDACAEEVARLRANAELLDVVDEGAVRKYAVMIRTIKDLQKQSRQHEADIRAKVAEMDEIKTRWLQRINDLVDAIANRFSAYFEAMGFAGDVELNKGNHEADFGNYGLDIKVTYRSSQKMERLNPFQQSGGERSVATALYMLALQELTVVPFRCVDEINQGMDARNERLVFQLLVTASCRQNNSSSQYFLVTPKLLPDLDYGENMTVLAVSNGANMCPHAEWDVDAFVDAAEEENVEME